MHRRNFLIKFSALGALVPLTPLWAQTSFENFKQQQQQGFSNYQAQLDQDFKTYQNTITQEFNNFKQQVSAIWGDANLGSAKVLVSYSPDLTQRTLIDYERSSLTVELIAPTNAPNMGRQTREALIATAQTQVAQSYAQDPLLQKIDKRLNQQIPNLMHSKPSNEYLIADILTGQTQPKPQQIEQAVIQAAPQGTASKRPAAQAGQSIFTFSIPLKETQTSQKAALYRPVVQKYAQIENLDPALVLAIMHSESAFNPLAKSHVPAYGLMQIVPQSAGKDASEKVYGQQHLLSPSYLYNSDNNIKMGCAYLNILYYRYLNKITNHESRTYCVIAAYNTGSGNVAKAFNAGTNTTKAAEQINRLNPQQVYQQLVNNLPYAETRNYLKAVLPRYQAYLQKT